MSGRLVHWDGYIFRGKCYNSNCDSKLLCKRFDATVPDTIENVYPYLQFCEQCNAYVPLTKIVAEDEPDRPYIESY
jgi:hypothetical protein